MFDITKEMQDRILIDSQVRMDLVKSVREVTEILMQNLGDLSVLRTKFEDYLVDTMVGYYNQGMAIEAKKHVPHVWKNVDLTDGDGTVRLNVTALDPNAKIKLNGIGGYLESGGQLALVKTEEIWSVDSDSGECETVYHSHSSIRYIADEPERDVLKSELDVDEIAVTALSRHFN